ncbi:MAG: uracil phosphoribosyltransferase [Vicinamibacterales bacterium]
MPVHLVDHPIVQDALLELRDQSTTPAAFRTAAARLTTVLATEALRDLPSRVATVDTPLGPATGRRLAGDIVIVPVLRAGLGMMDAILSLAPCARVGHVGLQRDEATAVASQYYARFPPRLESSFVLMVDPMLATGGSAMAALELLRQAGAHQVHVLCIVAAPEGVAALDAHFPHVHVFTAVVDQGLNARKFIVPGLGDFGDRLYGTH